MGTAGMHIVDADPVGDPGWDRFVRAHPLGRVSHLAAAATMLRRVYGGAPRHLAAHGADGDLLGVLPLVCHHGLLRGRRLESLGAKLRPGGPLAADPEVARALMARAARDSRKRLSILSDTPGLAGAAPGLRAERNAPTWLLELPASSEELQERVGRNVRRRVRRAAKAGVTIREGAGETDLRGFYALYLESMRRHHTLPLRYAGFAMLRDLLAPAGSFQFFVAEVDGEMAGAVTCSALGDGFALDTLATDLSRRDLHLDQALNWHALEWAIEAGLSRADFGEAALGSSLAEFKRSWGAEPAERWHYVQGVPAAADEPLRQRYRLGELGLAGRAWNHVPLPATQLVGELAHRML